MKRFVLVHLGFEKPTEEIMEKWNNWFQDIKDINPENIGGFMNGIEITKEGIESLPLDKNSITGFSIINANNMGEAQEIAKSCPFISSIRIYEPMEVKK